MEKITLTKQLELFENGTLSEHDEYHGFFDWFCSDKALKGKSDKLFKMVKRWVKKRNTDTDKVYVFFKNNCPVNGPLYDDFRICDIETGDVIWTVTPKCGHSDQAEVWGKQNDFKEPIAVGKSMNDIFKQNF
jgi:hypothetical protein